ncbi:RNA methyltransferase [Marivirga sp. S37H4]|uniref:tRNA (guanosine(18)-2'-O)-methyltransferase n=1 Tax=Marivirga aurantiaca TaxID=2802615 RepID=A0A935C6E5_9BACT|nr:RNA methyltransferase [Marivirga aurantiaca]MBK6264324.1 RNA methyltransferase [Marivirga aurantiaca]
MDTHLQQFLIQKYSEFLSEERKNYIHQVLSNRTEYIRVVLEDLTDPHNVNAVFRTGECLGIQHYDVIENNNPFKIGKGVSRGATKWIDIHQYNQQTEGNTLFALKSLKKKGYKILVTSPNEKAKSMEEIDISQPIALVFGNEKEGVSREALQIADEIISIPNYGFTESYNVSVSAAILLYNLIHRMYKEVNSWQFSPEVYSRYHLAWLKKCMARPDYYQNYFVKAFDDQNNI